MGKGKKIEVSQKELRKIKKEWFEKGFDYAIRRINLLTLGIRNIKSKKKGEKE